MCKQFGIVVIRACILVATSILLVGSFILMTRSGFYWGQLKSWESAFDASAQTKPFIPMILGCIIFALTIFGFFAITMNALGMTVFYICAVVAFGVAVIIVGINLLDECDEMYPARYHFTNNLNRPANMTGLIEPDIDNWPTSAQQAGYDIIYMDLMCCGITDLGYEWYNKGIEKNLTKTFPTSCCKNPIQPCFKDEIWADDCLEPLEIFGANYLVTLAALCLCTGGQCIMVAAIGYVFAMAVRQYYYY